MRHEHDGRWASDCVACQHNDANWRRQVREQADAYAEAEAENERLREALDDAELRAGWPGRDL